MSLNPSISPTQNVGTPSIIDVLDNSTGSDPNITSRTILIKTADGTELVNSVWPIANSTASYDVLQTDQAVTIDVKWKDAGGNTLYEFKELYEFNQYNSQFSVDLTRVILSSPSILQDKDFWLNKMILRVNIDDAEQAVSLADDIYLAQGANERASYMKQHQKLFF